MPPQCDRQWVVSEVRTPGCLKSLILQIGSLGPRGGLTLIKVTQLVCGELGSELQCPESLPKYKAGRPIRHSCTRALWMWSQRLGLSWRVLFFLFFFKSSWMRTRKFRLRNGCKLFLRFSSSARVVLQLLLYIYEEKDFPGENTVLQKHQLHLPLR